MVSGPTVSAVHSLADLYGPLDVAARAGVSPYTILSARWRAQLPPPIKIRGRCFWRITEIEAWLQTRREQGAA
jgi:predicted DNA-binding transcriptional regulator AlpA